MKKKRKIILFAITGFVTLAAAIFLVINVIIPGSKYHAAEELMTQKRYGEAAAAFEALGNSGDSAERARDAFYLAAEQLLAEGRFEEAAETFEKLGDYYDSAERAAEARALCEDEPEEP